MDGPLISSWSMETPSLDKGKLATPLVARLNLAAECSLAQSMYGEWAVLLEYVMRLRSVSKCNTWERRPPRLPCRSMYFRDMCTEYCRPRPGKPRKRAQW